MDENGELERARFELERTKVEQEHATRQQELKLQSRDLELKRIELRAGTWRNPLLVAIAAAALGAFGNIVVTYLQNTGNQKLASLKAQSDLIIESTRTSDPKRGKENLQFFIKAGFIQDPDGKISKLLDEDLYPSLPPAKVAELAQREWVPEPGQKPDYQAALKHWKMVAEQNQDPALAAYAMGQVGWMYENALGVPRDCNEAMAWYQKSYSHGYTTGSWNIGRLYDIACGFKERDCAQARLWYEKAKANGLPEAIRDLRKLDEEGCH